MNYSKIKPTQDISAMSIYPSYVTINIISED